MGEIPFDVYFWDLKYGYPGSPDFCLGNYGDLPYQYVISAVQNLGKRRLTDLSLNEKPTALLTSVLANSNRDSKRQRKPYTLEDFTIYKRKEDLNLPTRRNAAAAVKAIEAGLMPTWALFIYPDLVAAYDENTVINSVILAADDAILLNPSKSDNGFIGLLVARESSSLSKRLFTDENGSQYWLEVPHVGTKVVAEESVELTSCRPFAK